MKRALLLALALVACDSGDDTETTGGSGSCPEPTAAEGDVCVLSGEITTNLTLTADRTWLLRGGVFIGDDSAETVLTVEPGTIVYGETATKGMLVIRRGSKLVADGTKDAPIVFTSPKEDGSRARGDWGGLIINGRAPINGCNEAVCEAEGEGGTGLYGGDDPNDNSGVLRYVRVEYAGILLSEDNELNGIAFQGVGAGTTVDYVQVHMNKDDGVEFFGGTVRVRHILLTGIGDDCLDWTDGWVGKAQWVAAVQFPDSGDQGIEADNNGENNDATPRSHPTLANVTLVGSGGENSDIGMLLREGTGANIFNAVVTNFGEAGLALDQAATFTNAGTADTLSGELTVNGTILWNPDASEYKDPKPEDVADPPFTVEAFFTTMNANNRVTDPGLASIDWQAPDLRPAAGSAAATGAVDTMDPWFDATDYVGAFSADSDWTDGWTNWAPN